MVVEGDLVDTAGSAVALTARSSTLRAKGVADPVDTDHLAIGLDAGSITHETARRIIGKLRRIF